MPSSPETSPQASDSRPEDLLQELAGDDHSVDLVGALIDLGDLQKPRSRPDIAAVGGVAGAQMAQLRAARCPRSTLSALYLAARAKANPALRVHG